MTGESRTLGRTRANAAARKRCLRRLGSCAVAAGLALVLVMVAVKLARSRRPACPRREPACPRREPACPRREPACPRRESSPWSELKERVLVLPPGQRGLRVVVFAAVGLITVAAVIIGAGRHLPGTTLLVGAAEGPRVSISVYALVIGVTCAVAAWVLVLAGLFFADWRVRLPGLVLVGTGAAAERHVLGRQLSFFGAAPGLAALAGVLTLGALTIAAEVWPRRDEALRIDTRSPPWTRLIFIAIVVVVLVVYAGQAIRLGGLASLGQGSVAVLEQAGPGPGQSGAASPWTRPPEQPAPYRLPARLSDMLHGWLDGRRGIPELPNGRTSAVSMAAAPDTETDDPKLSDSPDVAKPQIRPPTPWTPRIGVLVRRSRELIEEERIRFADDWSELKRRSIGHQLLLDPLKEQVTALEERLNQARVQ